jgi:hypothetical protein
MLRYMYCTVHCSLSCSFLCGALLGYYAASSDNFLRTFRDNLSVISLEFKNPNESSLAALTTPLLSLSTTCINPTGWHHTIQTFHLPHSSLYKLTIRAAVCLLYSWNLRIWPRGFPETSVRNYHHSLSNNPEEWVLFRGNVAFRLSPKCEG